MNPNNSKSMRDADPVDEETEDSPSTVNLNEGDLRIVMEDHPKFNLTSKPSRKTKTEIEQVETYIEDIKVLCRSNI